MVNKRELTVAALACAALLAGCKEEESGGNMSVAGTGAAGASGTAGAAGTAGTTAGVGAAGTTAIAGAGGTSAAGAGGAAGSAGAAAGAGGAAGATAGAGAGGTDGTAGTTAGTGGAGGAGGTGEFTIGSADFEDGGMLPSAHRCVALNGATGPSPALSWSGAPQETLSYAVTMTDLTYMDYAHWTIYDIPASVTELAQGVPAGAMPSAPAGAKQAPNSPFLTGPGYFGPCGSSGVNTYEFTVYALDVATLPDLTGSSTVAQVRTQIEAHAIETAAVTAMSGP